MGARDLTRIGELRVMLLVLLPMTGCAANHRVDGNAGDASAAQSPHDSVVLEVGGLTFSLCRPLSLVSISGYSCGDSTTGSGLSFDTAECAQSTSPAYSLDVLFHDVGPAGIVAGTTFDLADPGREQHVTLALHVAGVGEPVFDYCTAVPVDDGGAPPAVSGTVVVHQYGLVGTELHADVEVVNAVVPPLNAGPRYTVVSAHLYFDD